MSKARITSSKPEETVISELSNLRKLINSTKDPVLREIAYAMETAIIWSTHRTVGWEKPYERADSVAMRLRRKLREADK